MKTSFSIPIILITSLAGPTFVFAALTVTPGAHAALANISITRDSAARTASGGDTVTEYITLTDESGSYVPDVTYSDTLLDSGGAPIIVQNFDVGPMAPEDIVHLSYDLHFSHDSAVGSYILNSEVGGDGVQSEIARNGTVSIVAPKSALSVPIPLSGTGTSPFGYRLSSVTATNIRIVVTSASTSPMRDPIKRETMIAAASAVAPSPLDPGVIFAAFYTFFLLGFFALVQMAVRSHSAHDESVQFQDRAKVVSSTLTNS